MMATVLSEKRQKQKIIGSLMVVGFCLLAKSIDALTVADGVGAIGKLLPAGPYGDAPFTEAQLGVFIDSYFEDIDLGTTANFPTRFTPEVKMGIIRNLASGEEEMLLFKGIAEGIQGAEDWFDGRGEMQAATTYTVKEYSYPMVVIQGNINTQVDGDSYFTLIWMFQNQKIAFGLLNLDVGQQLSPDVPSEISNLFDEYYGDINAHNPETIMDIFSPVGKIALNHRFTPGDVMTNACYSGTEEMEKASMTLMDIVYGGGNITPELVAYHWPLYVTKTTMAKAGQTIFTTLGYFLLDKSLTDTYQVLRQQETRSTDEAFTTSLLSKFKTH